MVLAHWRNIARIESERLLQADIHDFCDQQLSGHTSGPVMVMVNCRAVTPQRAVFMAAGAWEAAREGGNSSCVLRMDTCAPAGSAAEEECWISYVGVSYQRKAPTEPVGTQDGAPR